MCAGSLCGLWRGHASRPASTSAAPDLFVQALPQPCVAAVARAERRVREVLSHGSVVQHYEGEKGAERHVRMLFQMALWSTMKASGTQSGWCARFFQTALWCTMKLEG